MGKARVGGDGSGCGDSAGNVAGDGVDELLRRPLG